MRRGSIVALLIMLAIAAGFLGNTNPSTLAQDATPPPGELQGVNVRAVATGSLEVLAPGTAFMSLGRIGLEPGAAVPFDPTDPSAVLIYMASGELTFQVEAPMTIARRGAPGTPVPTEPEAVEANTAFTMREGDSALFPPLLAGEVRNEGTEPASAWLVNLAVITDAPATPTP